MRRSSLVCLAVIGCAHQLTLAQPELLWFQQFGTPTDERTRAVAHDGTGGAYIAGPRVFARYDGDGEQLWAQFEYTGISALLYDGADGVFAGVSGGAAALLKRFDGDGATTWTSTINEPDRDEYPQGICPDGQGGVFLSGTSAVPLHYELDVGFLARFDSAGQQLWFTWLGPPGGTSHGGDLASDGHGGLFLRGQSSEDLGGLGPGSFLARYDADGNRIWIQQPLAQDFAAMTPDLDSGVFTTGFVVTQDGDLDAVVSLLDNAGNELWSAQFGTPADDGGAALFTDADGGVAVAAASRPEVLLAAYDSAGAQKWLTAYDTLALESVQGLVTDGAGGLILGGWVYVGGEGGDDTDAFLARFGNAEPPCFPDLDASGSLDLFDFLAFLNLFNAEDPTADCTTDGAFDLFDFLCFVNAFNAGC